MDSKLSDITQKTDSVLPLSLQKIGIKLIEILHMLDSIDNDCMINDYARERIAIVTRSAHDLVDLVDKHLSGKYIGDDETNDKKESDRFIEIQEYRCKKFLKDVDKAIFYSMENGKGISIDSLTDFMCMSRSTLYRHMKSLTGLSPNEYIRKKRMEVAKEMLIDGDMSMDEIADKVGCGSMSYFRQSFKETYGVIPSVYLRRLRERVSQH